MRIRKGDKVQVLTGKDRGKQANVARAIPAENKVIVEGVHVAKRHAKPTRATMQGGVIDKFMPISASSRGHRLRIVRADPHRNARSTSRDARSGSAASAEPICDGSDRNHRPPAPEGALRP